MRSDSTIKRFNNGHKILLGLYIYIYKYLIKNLQYFMKKLTKLAGNIYRNNLKNTVTLRMGQLLFLKISIM